MRQPEVGQAIGPVLDDAVGIFKAAIASVLVLAFASALVRSLPYLYTNLSEILSPSGVLANAGTDPDRLLAILGNLLIGVVVTWPVSIFLSLGVIIQMDHQTPVATRRWQTALGLAWQRLPSLAGCLVVYASVLVAIFGSALLAGGLLVSGLPLDMPASQVMVVAGLAGMAVSLVAAVPLTVLFVYWCLALPLIATENLAAVPALRRSWRLVNGHWWRVLAVVSVAGFIVFALESLASIAGMLLVAATDGGLGVRLAAVLLNASVATVTTPLFLAALLAMLKDLAPKRRA